MSNKRGKEKPACWTKACLNLSWADGIISCSKLPTLSLDSQTLCFDANRIKICPTGTPQMPSPTLGEKPRKNNQITPGGFTDLDKGITHTHPLKTNS